MGFAHLHVHTQYSLLDGACRIKDLIYHIKKLGQSYCAITDHGNMFGAPQFYKECKKEGITPIIGCEVYVAKRSRFDKEAHIDVRPYHLTLLCKNEIGYKNLIKLVSLGYTQGFYSKPRVDLEILNKYHEGLIALSGCLSGEVSRHLVADDYTKAKQTALKYLNIFGEDNYFIEIQDHNLNDEKKILKNLNKLSQETNIGLVATNDAHYILKKDATIQETLVCIQTGSTLQEGTPLSFSTSEFYLKSEQEMREIFKDCNTAIDNTIHIAKRCKFDFSFGKMLLPSFEPPYNISSKDYFLKIAKEGLFKFYGKNPAKDIVKRFNYEAQTIENMGFIDYFLIVYDYVKFAKNEGIPVGPGRGSGAGSIIAYCMGITTVDPIRYGLIFERFLNPQRISMPDFDVDFCNERRGEVIDYVIKKYGKDHVSQIITFGTMAAKGAIRDVGRVMGLKYSDVDKIAKAIPFSLGITLNKALEESADLKRLIDSKPEYKTLFETALKLEGMPRNASTHAAAVVITKDKVVDYVPLAKNDDIIVTQYSMDTIADLGLLKMDFLGLRNLTIIDDCEKAIRLKDSSFSVENISYEDKKTFEMLSQGKSDGIFQFESDGMKQVLIRVKPSNIEDLIAILSLYRPGPSKFIDTFIRNIKNPDRINYKDEKLRPILDVTYGVIIYQEQVMQIFRDLAGYSFGRADLVRRAISKKETDVMVKEREYFVNGKKDKNGNTQCKGAVKLGIAPKIANEIFDDMSDFASYAFNKSHAAAYSIISFKTAYLKCHYPHEYLAALLNSIISNSDKVLAYINECKKENIDLLPPDINESGMGFTVVGDKIRFGLLAIKNIGKGMIDKILKEREKGLFVSMENFIETMASTELGKQVVLSLIKSGAFDSFSANRRQMIESYEQVLEFEQNKNQHQLKGQVDLFSIENSSKPHFKYPDVDEYKKDELIAMEKELTGLYLSGHPLDKYRDILNNLNLVDFKTIQIDKHYVDNVAIKTCGIIVSIKEKITRNGDKMAFIKLEDYTKTIELIVFPNTYKLCLDQLFISNAILVEAQVSVSSDGLKGLKAKNITPLKNLINSPKRKLYLKLSSKNDPNLNAVFNILYSHKGGDEVVFYLADTKKYYSSPKKIGVSISLELKDKLIGILGENNVVIKHLK